MPSSVRDTSNAAFVRLPALRLFTIRKAEGFLGAATRARLKPTTKSADIFLDAGRFKNTTARLH